MKFEIEELPFKKVSDIAESFVTLFGVTSDIEIDSVILNINIGGRGIPLSKYANSRGWNQAKVYALLKKPDDRSKEEEPYSGLDGLGYLDKNNIVTSLCRSSIDGGRKEDPIVYMSDFTLYNAPDGTVMINTKSSRIDRIKGEMFGLKDCDSTYRADFRKANEVKNKKILESFAKSEEVLFPNLKMEYRPIVMSTPDDSITR